MKIIISSYRQGYRPWITNRGYLSTNVSSLIEKSVAPFPGTVHSNVLSSRPTRGLMSKRGSVHGKITHLPLGNRKTAKDVAISRGGCGRSSPQFYPSLSAVVLAVHLAFNGVSTTLIKNIVIAFSGKNSPMRIFRLRLTDRIVSKR